jgi:hypothetical protein
MLINIIKSFDIARGSTRCERSAAAGIARKWFPALNRRKYLQPRNSMPKKSKGMRKLMPLISVLRFPQIPALPGVLLRFSIVKMIVFS